MKKKEYIYANQDPLYWVMVLGFFIFVLLFYYVLGIGFALAFISSLLGIIIYVVGFRDHRLTKENKKKVHIKVRK